MSAATLMGDVLTPFGVHVLRHAVVLGLLLLAAALVAVAILRFCRDCGGGG